MNRKRAEAIRQIEQVMAAIKARRQETYVDGAGEIVIKSKPPTYQFVWR